MADRPEALLEQTAVTGIDFVFVHADQTQLDVHFRLSPAALLPTPLVDDLEREQVRIECSPDAARGPAIRVDSVSWTGDVLELTTAAPGDFGLYRLAIDDPRIDPYFNGIHFSFKAGCASDLDCRPRPHECPQEQREDVAVDYRARDYASFRRALLDFATLRHPDWQDNGRAADAATMLVELMSALADELAYYQDRVGREAHLETATQRRSVRRHLRLVDYELHNGLGANAWLDVTVLPGQSGTIPDAAGLVAASETGAGITYEVGRTLDEPSGGHAVDAARNSLAPHIWDDDDVCLPVGATELTLAGSHGAALPLEAANGARPGRWALLRTSPADPAREPRVHLVRLISVVESIDPVFAQPITTVAWEDAQATPFELDLRELELRGNIVHARAGRTLSARFSVGANSLGLPTTVERSGPDGTVAFLFTLPDPGREALVWAGSDPRSARPELRLFEEDPGGGPTREWGWRRSLVAAGAQGSDALFALDDGSWRRVLGFRRDGAEAVHADYADGDGATIRFGDGEFGRVPPRGTMFRVDYRLGSGRRGNVAAGSLLAFDPPLPFVHGVTNPVPGTGGIDPEPIADARRLAPDAFRALTFRAVRPEDYAEAAERLAWVQRAGASFRWTGSWLSAFVTPDPRGAVTITTDEREELVDQLDRFRQAGREVHALDPLYADVDLELTVCVEPSAFAADVEERVLARLVGTSGFFAPDNFTFGTPLERSVLEAAVQGVPGVRAVEGIRIRRRGRVDWRSFDELAFEVAANEVLRVESDPLHPDRGSLAVVTRGGA